MRSAEGQGNWAYIAATLIDGVLVFSNNLSTASYAGAPIFFTA